VGLAVLIPSAHGDDGGAAVELLKQVPVHDFPRLQTLFAASKSHNPALADWLAPHRPGWRSEGKGRPEGTTGFLPVRKRWGVERTKAGNGRARRHSKDYERRPDSAAALLHLSTLHLLLRNLAPSTQREFHYDAAA
jgi:putative transposase